jgi:hypothetical protein
MVAAGPSMAQGAGKTVPELALASPLFAGVFQLPPPEDGGQPPSESFFRGLAAYALKDFGSAVSFFATTAQNPSDPETAVRAAVMASMALAQLGDREATCEYSAVVQELAGEMPAVWRGWLEETRRANYCG